MPWIELTEAHITESLSAVELEKLREFQLAPGQVDPLPEAISRTCGQVQGYVAVRYQVGQPGTIPEQLLTSAISIGRWRMLGRLPVKALSTDHRRKEYEDAIAELRDVAAGKMKLSIPDEPAADQPGSTGAEVVSETTRDATRQKMEGL